MPDSTTTAISRWFGGTFADLHPLIQQLHSAGGTLSGTVHIQTGHGLAGVLGRRLAKQLGVPVDRPERGFRVDIAHSESAMHWNRCFEDHGPMNSTFIPVGTIEDGCLLEQTGLFRAAMTVDVVDGAWHWRVLKMTAGVVPVPLFLLPGTQAYKSIEDGKYRFAVSVSAPGLGVVLSYSGLLEAVVHSR